ncbi:MAG: beta-lactamase family protein [Arcicella sp.]|nr:beta-lactamase family protein [Arcicella sp.]
MKLCFKILIILMAFANNIFSQVLLGNLQEKVLAVENGLMLPIYLKDSTVAPMNLLDRMKFHHVKGLSIAVINDGKIEWAKGYGVKNSANEPVTENTIFQAGAISKLVTSVISMKLVESGKISLDEDINNKLISFKVPENEFTVQQKVTLRRLLTHNAGLENVGLNSGAYPRNTPLPKIINILKGELPAANKPILVSSIPGTNPRVAGEGYVIVQQLIEDLVKQPFTEYAKTTVLDKLGMTKSTFQQDLPASLTALVASGNFQGKELLDKWKLHPACASGGLWSTPSDIAKFFIEIQKASHGKNNKLFSASIAQQMLSSQKGNENRGIGFYLNGANDDLTFYHRGWSDGYTSYALAFKNTGQGVVIMTNSDNEGYKLMMEIVRSVASAYHWTKILPLEAQPSHEMSVIKSDTTFHHFYWGEYLMDGRKLANVFSNAQQLYIQFDNIKTLKLYPINEDEFITEEGENLKFLRFSGEAAAGIRFKDPIYEYVAKKIGGQGHGISINKVR